MNYSRQLTSLIVSMARRQHGVISKRQILEAGIHEGAIRGRRDSGWLLPVCPGVYAVGRQITSSESFWTAALLAVGRDACLTRRSAGSLWQILDWRFPVEVATSGRARTVRLRPPGTTSVVVVRASSNQLLTQADVTVRNGIRVAKIEPALLDLAAVLGDRPLRYAFNEADRRGLLNHDDLESVLERAGRRKGVDRFRSLVETRRPETAATRSELEVMFIELCRKSGLPLPEINQMILGLEVDFLWRNQRLIIELDGYKFHRGAMAFHRDAERDNDLRLGGYRVVRFTYPAVKSSPEKVGAIVRAELGNQMQIQEQMTPESASASESDLMPFRPGSLPARY